MPDSPDLSQRLLAQLRFPCGDVPEPGPIKNVAPGIYGEPAGAKVPVWLDPTGTPATPPQGAGGMLIGATMAGLALAATAAVVLTVCYRGCQRVLDRRRIADWSSDWAITGPQWSRRQ